MKHDDEGNLSISGELKELDRGLVLYLDGTYDEVNGWFTDQSGNGNHGIPYNGATTGTGIVGDGMSFDGTDDYISLNPDMLDSASSGTVSMWVNIDSFDKLYNTLFVKGKGASWAETHMAILRHGGTSYMVCNIGDNSNGTSYEGTFGNPQTLQTFVHMVATWDGNYLKTYTNAALISSYETSILPASDSTYCYIGRGADGRTRETKMLADEIRIYDRALEPEEIKQLYELGCAKLHDGTNASYDLGDLVVPEIIEGESKMKMTYQNLYCNEITEGVTF